MSEYDIRPVAVDERRLAVDAFRTALLSGAVNDESFAEGTRSWDESDSLAAWDDDECVGVVAAFRFDSTVPGGTRVPTAGVTRVGVLPTHTRRGLLTQLIHRLLRESGERGNVLATHTPARPRSTDDSASDSRPTRSPPSSRRDRPNPGEALLVPDQPGSSRTPMCSPSFHRSTNRSPAGAWVRSAGPSGCGRAS